MPKLGTKLKQDSIPLSYTPRKFASHPSNSYFYIIEADHRVTGPDAAAKKVAELVRSHLHFGVFNRTNVRSQRSQGKMVDDEMLELPAEVFGRSKAPAGTWASCIRIVDPAEVASSSKSRHYSLTDNH